MSDKFYRCAADGACWSAAGGGMMCPRCGKFTLPESEDRTLDEIEEDEDDDDDELNGDAFAELQRERDQLRAAAGAMLAAFGGDVPDWLRTEAAALQAAIDGAPAALHAPAEIDLAAGWAEWASSTVPHAEGWLISNRSDGCDEIQRDDGTEILPSDDAALALVIRKALEGSELHRWALAVHADSLTPESEEAKS